jgi:hypothetical protein
MPTKREVGCIGPSGRVPGIQPLRCFQLLHWNQCNTSRVLAVLQIDLSATGEFRVTATFYPTLAHIQTHRHLSPLLADNFP